MGHSNENNASPEHGQKTLSLAEINHSSLNLDLLPEKGNSDNSNIILIPFDSHNKCRDSIDSVAGDKSHEQWISEMRESMKIVLIYTMITGILLSNHEIKVSKSKRRSVVSSAKVQKIISYIKLFYPS
jgi:hypothetical protein